MTLWIFLVVFASLCAIISIIVTLFICYHLLMDKTSFSHLHKPVKYFSIFSAICFSLSATTSSISVMYWTKKPLLIPPDPIRADIAQSFVIINLSFWVFGMLFLYLLIISRLKIAYQHSIFKIRSYILTILYMLLILLLLFTIADIITISILYYNDSVQFLDISYDTYAEWNAIILICAECNHLVISIVLVYMFVSRLLKLVYMVSDDNIKSKHHYGSMDGEILSIDFTAHQQSILNVVTKQSILSVVAIISSQICLLSTTILVTGFNGGDTFFKITLAFNVCIMQLDCVVNCICILLILSSQRNVYLAVCGKCDECLQILCAKYVRGTLWKQYSGRNHESLLSEKGVELSKSRN